MSQDNPHHNNQPLGRQTPKQKRVIAKKMTKKSKQKSIAQNLIDNLWSEHCAQQNQTANSEKEKKSDQNLINQSTKIAEILSLFNQDHALDQDKKQQEKVAFYQESIAKKIEVYRKIYGELTNFLPDDHIEFNINANATEPMSSDSIDQAHEFYALWDSEPVQKLRDKMSMVERSLFRQIQDLFTVSPHPDRDLEMIYHHPRLSVEDKALLREVVTKVFGTHVVLKSKAFARVKELPLSSLPEDETVTIVDVFGLPCFGSIDATRQLFANKDAMARLCRLILDSGYISSGSDFVALMSVPLSCRPMHRPTVLNNLTSVWGDMLVHRDKITDTVAQTIQADVIESLRQFEIKEGTTGFVLPAVRIWTGFVKDYKNIDEIVRHWHRVSSTSKMMSRSWWQVASADLIARAGVRPGDLMIRPPAPPLVASSQALAWHISHQIYDRLGVRPFGEITFVSVNNNQLALRAFDHREKLLAQSDHVDLFDVITSADDFSATLQEECGPDGPVSFLRDSSWTPNKNPK